MTIPVWPGTLPQFVHKPGYSEKPGENTLETPVDAGPAKSRRRYTGQVRRFSVTVEFTPAQQATFETFYQNELADGSLKFTWLHPRTRAAATFIFRKPHWAITGIVGINTMVQLTLEQTA